MTFPFSSVKEYRFTPSGQWRPLDWVHRFPRSTGSWTIMVVIGFLFSKWTALQAVEGRHFAMPRHFCFPCAVFVFNKLLRPEL